MDAALMQEWKALGNGLGLNRALGITVTSIGDDEVTVAVALDDITRNHVGTLHAVAQAGAAELAAAMVAGVALGDLVEQSLVPVQAGFRVRYRRPVHTDAVAHGTVDRAAADEARAAHARGERPRLPVEVVVRADGEDASTFSFDVVFVPVQA